MLIILLFMVVFFFLLVGAAVFLCSDLIPWTRSHALTAALWCAVWGPCTVSILLLAGLGLIAGGAANEHSSIRPERLLSVLGPVYFGLALIGMTVIASVIALLHEKIIQRLTFALFRIYACLVTTGIGSVFGWTLYLWMLTNDHLPGHVLLWLAAMFLICGSFGYAGYRWAKQLRGDPPETFTWITPQEYEGTR